MGSFGILDEHLLGLVYLGGQEGGAPGVGVVQDLEFSEPLLDLT